MKLAARTNTTKRVVYYGSWVILITLFVALPLPHLNDHAWDYDEGPQIQAAALAYHGYALYSEVVVNKPPLLSWLLELGFCLGGVSIPVARFTMLMINLLGFVALGLLAEIWWGQGAGIFTLGIFLALPEIPVRAPVIMNDLPLISLGTVALLAATLFRKKGTLIWLALSAVIYAAVLQIHPLGVFLIIPLLLILLLPYLPSSIQVTAALRTLLIWGAIVFLITFATILAIDAQGFIQWVYRYNFSPVLTGYFQRNIQMVRSYGVDKWPLFVMAAAGSYVVVMTRRRVWFGVALVWEWMTLLTLLMLRPLWFHYQVLLLYPLVMIAGGGLFFSFRWLLSAAEGSPYALRGGIARWSTLCMLVAFMFFFVQRTDQSLRWPLESEEAKAKRTYLANLEGVGKFALADNQFLVFAGGYLVPPPLADTSFKRITAGLLNVADLLDAIVRYQVPLLVFDTGRLASLPAFEDSVARIATEQVTIGDSRFYHLDPQVVTPETEVEAVFGDQVLLQGYSVGETVTPGEVLVVTFFWESLVPMDTEYKVFVHLVDEVGELVAQHDGMPFMGANPTAMWETGTRTPDPHVITLEGVPPGRYELRVGLYSWPSLQRLPAFANGVRLDQDSFVLERTEIQP
jgi:hypothetical protein